MRRMMRHVRHAAWTMAIGAALAYFLDPDLGADRRRVVVDRLRSLTDTTEPPGHRTPDVQMTDTSAVASEPVPEPSVPPSPPVVTSPSTLGSV